MDLVLLMACFALVVLLVLFAMVLRGMGKVTAAEKGLAGDGVAEDEAVDDAGADGRGGARGGRNRMLRRRRVAPGAGAGGGDDAENLAAADDDAEGLAVGDVGPDGKKLTAKKAAKLAMKSQRAAEAKAREEERDERRKEDAEFWATREAERKKELEESAKVEAEERKLEEEMERRDQAEFELWKGAMEVEDTGSAIKSADELEREAEEMIATLKRDKVVLLETLGLQFDLTGAQVVERLLELEAQGRVQGVVDDSGKYIYITPSEMEAIAKWVQRKGRVKLAVLAQHSNKLVNLSPDQR